jgi:hypothetical protein
MKFWTTKYLLRSRDTVAINKADIRIRPKCKGETENTHKGEDGPPRNSCNEVQEIFKNVVVELLKNTKILLFNANLLIQVGTVHPLE